jgi:pyridoxal phosphate enzyme (YggS family)
MSIKSNLQFFLENLPPDCQLIAVSKTKPTEAIQEAYDAGHRVFAENKVQELVPKYEALPKDIQWHLIGHLQTNKVKYIAPFVHLIHSIDSFKLLEEVNKQAQKVDRTIPCLLQLHIAEEETKFGFSEDEVTALLASDEFHKLTNVTITGLIRGLRGFFEKLKASSLPPSVSMRHLSMGMSSDYQIALEEGSTMIRVGSAIFGERSYI